jgi:hypothetical protein
MIRCHAEMLEVANTKKGRERAPESRRRSARLSFDDMLWSDEHRWLNIGNADELRALVKQVSGHLRSRDYPRFVQFIEGQYGTAFARRGGLPVGQPQLVLAS